MGLKLQNQNGDCDHKCTQNAGTTILAFWPSAGALELSRVSTRGLAGTFTRGKVPVHVPENLPVQLSARAVLERSSKMRLQGYKAPHQASNESYLRQEPQRLEQTRQTDYLPNPPRSPPSEFETMNGCRNRQRQCARLPIRLGHRQRPRGLSLRRNLLGKEIMREPPIRSSRNLHI